VLCKHVYKLHKILKGKTPINNIHTNICIVKYIIEPIKEYTKQSDTINTNTSPAKNIYDKNHKKDGSIGDKTI
jgi:hypothetical protein